MLSDIIQVALLVVIALFLALTYRDVRWFRMEHQQRIERIKQGERYL
jgi:hypothetical protein